MIKCTWKWYCLCRLIYFKNFSSCTNISHHTDLNGHWFLLERWGPLGQSTLLYLIDNDFTLKGLWVGQTFPQTTTVWMMTCLRVKTSSHLSNDDRKSFISLENLSRCHSIQNHWTGRIMHGLLYMMDRLSCDLNELWTLELYFTDLHNCNYRSL